MGRAAGQRRVASILTDGAKALGALSVAGEVTANTIYALGAGSAAYPPLGVVSAGNRIGFRGVGGTTFYTHVNGATPLYVNTGVLAPSTLLHYNNLTLDASTLRTASYTVASTNNPYDTTAGAFVATLPAAPQNGTFCEFWNVAGSANSLTIARNEKTIDGAAADLVRNTPYGHCRLVYNSTAGGWVSFIGK